MLSTIAFAFFWCKWSLTVSNDGVECGQALLAGVAVAPAVILGAVNQVQVVTARNVRHHRYGRQSSHL